MSPVFDAHAHLGDAQEIALRRRLGIRTMLSCATAQQARDALALAKQDECFAMTAGVHPWQADAVRLESLLPYMRQAALVGEIGLDSVWCSVPMDVQRRALSRQLDWAAASGKGIVLHTKGCEMEIARAVEGFPHPILVHWYAGAPDALDRFLSMGCHFTIGPDVAGNPAQQAVARLAARDRLLFETDGMDAVRWALGDLPAARLPDVLHASVRAAAALRGESPETLIQNANGRFLRLLGR